MLLAYTELVELVRAGVITNVSPEAINGTSIDVRLGNKFLIEKPFARAHTIDLAEREGPTMEDRWGSYTLAPQEFVLANTDNEFNLPDDISAQFALKSSIARAGLEHLNAGWIDPGFNGSTLTLELKNMLRYHHIALRQGMYIGQIKFFRHEAVPAEFSYAARGRYNNDPLAQGIKK